MRAIVFVLALFAAIPSAMAEDGRALVVAGRVMLERASPGAFSIAAVTPGTEVRRGDLVRTGNDGRVQIRFSDGSIVSLQPGTAFRIDEYRFAGDDRRAFFFLLRGALRTLTGAIGKTNHDEYRMKTPTATVGVRGTEYVAEQTVCDPRCAPGPRAGLRVAVTQGRIVLLTNAGTIEVGTGQAAAAESADAPPQHTERGPVLPPISLSEPRERTAGVATAAGAGGQTAAGTEAAASGQAATGTTGGPATKAATRTAGTPQAAGATETAGSIDESRAIGSDAFDPAAPGSGGTPALDRSGGVPTSGVAPASDARDGAVPLPSGTVQAPAPQRKERTNAALETGEEAADAVGADPLVDAWPRFVATESRSPDAAVSPNERRGPGGALQPVLERLGPGAGSDEPPAAPGGSGPGAGAPAPGDPGTGGPGTGGPVAGGPGTDPGAGGPGAGGPGDDPGAGGPGDDPGSGGLPGDDVPGPPSPPLASGIHPVDSHAAPGTRAALRVLEPWRLGMALRVDAGSLELDDSMQLSAFEWCSFDWLCRIGKGNTKVEDAGHDAWTSWGRWTAGQARATLLNVALPIAGNEGLHYLVGVPSATIPTSGVFGYELVGATRATLSPGSETGRFDGRAAVAFSPSGAQVGIDASVAFPNATYRFATPGGADAPALSPLVTGAGHAFRGQLPATGTGAPLIDCSAGCPVQLDGGLFGPEAARLGITYRITGTGGGPTISGVGVFGKKNPQE